MGVEALPSATHEKYHEGPPEPPKSTTVVCGTHEKYLNLADSLRNPRKVHQSSLFLLQPTRSATEPTRSATNKPTRTTTYTEKPTKSTTEPTKSTTFEPTKSKIFEKTP